MRARLSFLALLLVLGGCVYSRPLLQTGLDHPSRWSDQVRELAREAWIYVQLANNAYCAKTDLSRCARQQFRLPDAIVRIEARDNDDAGFAYAVYERRRGDHVAEVIVAYRGTEDLRDWWKGNIWPEQNRRGLSLFDQIVARYPGVPMTVTGHSLGGGIATNVSLWRAGVTSFVFNTSPRFRRGPQPIANRRESIAEHGEFLKLGRLFGREPDQRYTSIGCSNRMDPIRQHSIWRLAACLTHAAAWEDERARASLRRNGLPVPPDPLPRR